ncbi:MAG TPA: ABC transporter ATP-binding protein [Rhodopila sp.]|jgi:branched-chain amino acid transport system ATP-binding protein|nr:ABC transporter ATP-binding protein [Rhodopila sp.]
MTELLAIRRLGVSYGKVQAVRALDLTVEAGETVAVLGANGAGKSSIVRAITGLTHATAGEIVFRGQRVTNLPSDRRAAAGMALVPEGRRVFADMTVTENLQMGGYLVPKETAQRIGAMFDLFPRLRERRLQLAATLSGGEQQMLAIARALVRQPTLLILDEPSLGLSPIMVQTIYRAIRDLRDGGMTILLAEQSAAVALSLANRAYLLETGRVVAEGPAKALRDDPRVRDAYLGG